MTTKRTFDVALKAFLKSQTELMSLARECAGIALVHFAEHGDVSYIQRLHDALAKNFMRRVAFVAWACEHSPLVFEGGKFKKDTSETAVEFRVDEALQVDFWDFRPEATVEYYVGTDVIEALTKVVKNFESGKKKIPAPDSDAEVVLHAAKKAIANLMRVAPASPTSPASLN